MVRLREPWSYHIGLVCPCSNEKSAFVAATSWLHSIRQSDAPLYGILCLYLIAFIREGPALVTSGAISLNPTEDHPIFACRSNLSPDHDLAVDERMIIAARGLWLALITILLQDERRLLLMTMGDRIMRQLQQLSLRMLKRRRAVIRVVRSLMPMVLLDIIKDQAVQGEDGK